MTTSSKTTDAAASLLSRVEAVLITSDRSLSTSRLVELVGEEASSGVTEAIERLNEQYAATGRVFRIEQVASGWQVLTLPEHAEVIAKAQKTKAQTRLSASAMETLSVIAYRQPVIRAEVEAIRGVGCGEMIRQLMERQLVKVVGRAEEIGRPMLYGTTKRFLEVFGLVSLKDLPQRETLVPKERKASKPAASAEAEASEDAASGVEASGEVASERGEVEA
ncbi:SMC-Scp complex subunit ScpB [Mucisphaera calidilacus]|uniref:SMC-Scp complex subunit ScpB n=1 Tax=Mucisphaera calidilacus TaxID=2527982 RepID=UPI0011A845B1|nr:SMC-Scp complex subunit ScpB [Mucisphaera calidilacus]